MSLIQEALKRQQEEYGGEVTRETPSTVVPEPPVTETMPVMAAPARPAPPASPPRPPAGPAAPAVPVRPPSLPVVRGTANPWLKIAGIVVAALVILAVGGLVAAKWILKAGSARIFAKPAAAPAVAVPSSAAAVDVPAPAAEPAAIPEVGPAPPEAKAAREAEPPPAPPPAEAKPVIEKKPPAPAPWPVLKLTGILASLKAGEGAARINNQMIFVGGEINGVTLVEIRADGVLLKYGSETRFLKMGGIVY